MSNGKRRNLERLLQSAWRMQNTPVNQSNKKKPKRPAMHPAFLWIRSIALASILLGMAGVILSAYFWWGVAFVYVGFCLLFVDLFLEPKLKKHKMWQRSGLALIVCLAGLFTVGVVLVPAPIEVIAHGLPGDYATGTIIAGIPWNSAYSDLRISITNHVPQDYDNVDINISVDGYTMKAVLQNEVPSCSLTPINPIVEVHSSGIDPKTGKPFQQPLIPLGEGISSDRLRCEHLPSNLPLTIVVATANVRSDLAQAGTNLLPDAFFGPKKMPQWVVLDGTYRRRFKPYHINQKITVNVEH